MAKKQKQKSALEIKGETVSALSEKIKKAKTLIFADYHGLTVNQISQIRSKVKDAGGEVLVAKNTLMKRALAQNDMASNTGNHLVGPSASVFAYEDEVAPLKVLSESIKTLGLPKLKFGFFGKDLLDNAQVENLSKIPGRQQLQAQLVGSLSSPIYGIVSVLQANIRNLVSILDQVSKRT